jgi:hypothetical protein
MAIPLRQRPEEPMVTKTSDTIKCLDVKASSSSDDLVINFKVNATTRTTEYNGCHEPQCESAVLSKFNEIVNYQLRK